MNKKLLKKYIKLILNESVTGKESEFMQSIANQLDAITSRYDFSEASAAVSELEKIRTNLRSLDIRSKIKEKEEAGKQVSAWSNVLKNIPKNKKSKLRSLISSVRENYQDYYNDITNFLLSANFIKIGIGNNRTVFRHNDHDYFVVKVEHNTSQLGANKSDIQSRFNTNLPYIYNYDKKSGLISWLMIESVITLSNLNEQELKNILPTFYKLYEVYDQVFHAYHMKNPSRVNIRGIMGRRESFTSIVNLIFWFWRQHHSDLREKVYSTKDLLVSIITKVLSKKFGENIVDYRQILNKINFEEDDIKRIFDNWREYKIEDIKLENFGIKKSNSGNASTNPNDIVILDHDIEVFERSRLGNAVEESEGQQEYEDDQYDYDEYGNRHPKDIF